MSSGTKQIVMIAIDGSEIAKHAFHWMLENVYRDGVEVIIAHCTEVHASVGFPVTNDIDEINKYVAELKLKSVAVDEMTNEYMSILRGKKITAKVQVLQGKPGEALTKAAKESGVNHVVVGSRGLGTVRRTFLGSVSEYLVHHCDCPVTVVQKQ